MKDRFGLPLTTASEEATRFYVNGVDDLLSGQSGAVGKFEAAIANDPNFALAHLALGLAHNESGNVAAAKAGFAAAKVLAATASPREQAHIDALTELCAGVAGDGLGKCEKVLATNPHEALVLEEATRYLFFNGGDGKRRKVAELIAAVEAVYGDDWYILGRSAFHLQETQEVGQADRARDKAEASLRLNPHNVNAVHTLAHLSLRPNEQGPARDMIADWLSRHPGSGRLHEHLTWHLSLIDLERGRLGTAKAFFSSQANVHHRTGPKYLTMADAAGFLWRWWLAGHDRNAAHVDDSLLQLAKSMTAHPGKPFIDIQAALIFALAAPAELRRLETHYAQTKPGSIVLACLRGLGAFVTEDYERAREFLEASVDDNFESLGGSNIERLVLEQIYAESCRKSGKFEKGIRVLSARLQNIPSARTLFWLGRLELDAGLQIAGLEHLRQARALWQDADPGAPELLELNALVMRAS